MHEIISSDTNGYMHYVYVRGAWRMAKKPHQQLLCRDSNTCVSYISFYQSTIRFSSTFPRDPFTCITSVIMIHSKNQLPGKSVQKGEISQLDVMIIYLIYIYISLEKRYWATDQP